MEDSSKENEVAFDDVSVNLEHEEEQGFAEDSNEFEEYSEEDESEEDDYDIEEYSEEDESEEDDYGVEDMAADWDCTVEEVLEAWEQE